MKGSLLFILSLLAGVLIALAGWSLFAPDYQYQGVFIDPPVPAADFTLTDQNGNPFTLSAQKGKINLVFFGYTHCPDVCPTTLAEFRKVKESLGEQANQVNFILVTVDPMRDTPERLKEYLSSFDPDFIGLTGEMMAMMPIYEAYGVYVDHSEEAHANNTLVDHSARTYLIDEDGNWLLNFPFGMEYEKMVIDIRHLLKN